MFDSVAHGVVCWLVTLWVCWRELIWSLISASSFERSSLRRSLIVVTKKDKVVFLIVSSVLFSEGVLLFGWELDCRFTDIGGCEFARVDG